MARAQWLVAVALLRLVPFGLVAGPGSVAAQSVCYQYVYTRCWSEGQCPGHPNYTCYRCQLLYCADNAPQGPPTRDLYTRDYSNPQACPSGVEPKETCPDGESVPHGQVLYGCRHLGCMIGSGLCSCRGTCKAPDCNAPTPAACDPYNGQDEICGNGEDDNCDGEVDEGCAPEGPAPGGGSPAPSPPKGGGGGGGGDPCDEKAGNDPILLATRAAVTEPFTDFAASAVVGLGFERTWSSSDHSLAGGPAGVFGRG